MDLIYRSAAAAVAGALLIIAWLLAYSALAATPL